MGRVGRARSVGGVASEAVRALQSAKDFLASGAPAEGAALCEELIASLPGHAEAHWVLGQCLDAMGRPVSASEMYAKAWSIESGRVEFAISAARSLDRIGEHDAAFEAWQRVAAFAERRVRDHALRLQIELGFCDAALAAGAFELAAERAERVIADTKLFSNANERDRAGLLGLLASSLARCGRLGTAPAELVEREGAAFEGVVAAIEPHGGASLACVLAVEASYGLDADRRSAALDRLRPLVLRETEAAIAEGRASTLLEYACKVLGHAEEDQNDLAAAWRAYRLGNAVANGSEGVRWSASDHRAMVDRIIAMMSESRVREYARAPRAIAQDAGVRPVFIVGVPRSGTSLVEQVIAAHPGAIGRGELQGVWNAARWLSERTGLESSDDRFMASQSEADLADRASAYLAAHRAAALADDEAVQVGPPTVVTDKLPMNFLNLHVIWQLFPGAKIVWCVREAKDACFSCWSTPFKGDLAFTRDLELMSAFHREHDRLLRFWRSSGLLDVHVVRYESMVREPEAQSRSLLEFLELDWDASVLEFWRKGRRVLTASSEQATRPIYAKSIGRAARFAGVDNEIEEAVSTLTDR